MDQLILNLSYGLGLERSIGWFLPVFIGTINILSSILVLFQYADKSDHFNKNKNKQNSKVYDFIIVGGGSSGLLVANRLSRLFSVLVLEKGGEPNPLTSVPWLQPFIINNKETDYSYTTTSQNQSCLSLVNQESRCSCGVGLGGSSLINSFVYLRGHPYDYDIWAHWTNDTRWNYESLLPFFLKHEHYLHWGNDTTTNPNFHGVDGELNLSKGKSNLIVDEFLNGMSNAGIYKTDLNAPFEKGCDSVVYTKKFGRRMSSREAFLNHIRQNLTIIKYSTVSRVLIDDNLKAYGVEYEQFGSIKYAKVKKEIILSAGAINTPKILMLSGVGPKKQLEQFGIRVVVDLSFVGRNLQDHVGTLLGPFLINRRQPPLNNLDILISDYLMSGTGALSTSLVEAVSILPSSKSEFPDYPDIQTSLLPNLGLSIKTVDILSNLYNIKKELLTEYYTPLFNTQLDSFHLLINYARPRSRGELTLKSSNYRDNLIINTNYYSSQHDLNIVVEGISRNIKIVEQFAKLNKGQWPKCKTEKFKSSAYFECLAKELSLSLFHFVGTARMGQQGGGSKRAGAGGGSDLDSVVSSELVVWGVENLRVIDASVIPFINSMDIQAAVLLVAERGAQFILDKYKE